MKRCDVAVGVFITGLRLTFDSRGAEMVSRRLEKAEEYLLSVAFSWHRAVVFGAGGGGDYAAKQRQPGRISRKCHQPPEDGISIAAPEGRFHQLCASRGHDFASRN